MDQIRAWREGNRQPPGTDPKQTTTRGPKWWLITTGLILLGIFVLIAGIGGCASIYKTGPGEVALVRNGGPFDNKQVDTVTPPGSNIQFPGFWQDVRKYISSDVQRYYTISSDPSRSDSGGVDFVQVPTADGVQVKLDGTTYFHTTFTGENGDPTLVAFDTQFGNREFRVPGSDGSKKVYQGNDGWNAWLDAIFRPVLENTIREEIGQFQCAQLISSCALIQQGQQQGQPDFAELAKAGKQNQKNFEEVQTAVENKLQSRLDQTFGHRYLDQIQFRLVKVTLPEEVQQAINRAQSSFASISEEKANAEKAKFEAQRLRRLAQQYAKSPSLAMVDAAKALSKNTNAQIILSGQGLGLNVGK